MNEGYFVRNVNDAVREGMFLLRPLSLQTNTIVVALTAGTRLIQHFCFKVIRIVSRQMAEPSAPSVVRDAAMARDEVYGKNV